MRRTLMGLMALAMAGAVATAADDAASQSKEPAKPPASLVASTKLLGTSIVNGQNATIGHVETIVLNQNGEAVYVVAGVGGLAGIGKTYVAIPARAGTFRCGVTEETRKECKLHVALTEEQIAKAPPVSLPDYDALKDPNWLRSNAEYFGVAPPTDKLSKDKITCLKTITDAQVNATDNAAVGYLNAVILDTAKMRAEYGIVGDNATLGIGRKHFAVPYRQLKVATNADQKTIVMLPFTKSTVYAAPQVTPDEYPELNLPELRDRIEKAFERATGS